MNHNKHKYLISTVLVFFSALFISGMVFLGASSNKVYAQSFNSNPPPKYACGSNGSASGRVGFTPISINLNCQGNGCVSTDSSKGFYNSGGGGGYCSQYHNPIWDGVFAVIRFLSAGAGIVIIASTVYAGLQYILARDDPNGVAQAKDRIANNLIALVVFIFAYAILNFVVPGGFLT